MGLGMGLAINRISSRTSKTLTKAGRHADGNGLYLVVSAKGGRKWVFIYHIRGRRREMGLGTVADIDVAEARQMVKDGHELLRQGKDPVEARKAPKGIPTFAEMAKKLILTLTPGWRGKNTAANWTRNLLVHAKPLEKIPVDLVETVDVVRTLKKIWTTHPETAGKVKDQIEKVLDAAKVEGYRTGENPARWRGHLEHLLPKRKTLTRGHHRAIDHEAAPAFMAELRTRSGMGAVALEFTVLTVPRESMTLGARWREIDGDLWVIPKERMKENIEHRVPLSAAALAVLERVRPKKADPNALIFPGTKPGKQLSNMTMDAVLDRMKVDATPHGFRSTFRDWAGDCTDHSFEVAEAALAHSAGSAVVRAYRRGDALEKRRRLMDDWADYVGGSTPAEPEPQSESSPTV